MMSINATSHNFAIPVMGLGIRFRPTDEELIRYLIKYVSYKNYSCDDIRLEDLYGSKKPLEIFDRNASLSTGDEDTKTVKYFFTQLKKKKSDGTRFIRRVIGGGWWKGLDSEKSIYKGSKLVGFKKSYQYKYDKGDRCNDQVNYNVVWNMKEYSLDEKILKVLRQRRLIQHEDVVLCCVKRKISHNARDHKELGSSSEDQGTGVHNSCLNSDRFTSSDENNAFHELQQVHNSEQLIINQVQNIEEMAPFAQNHDNDYVASYLEQGITNFHDMCPVYQFTSSEHNAYQLQQDQNIEQVNVQEQNIEEMAPFDQYHNDYVTSYSKEGTTNFQDLPICIDNQLPQVQIEETTPSMLQSSDYYVEPPTTTLVINNDECFSMDELLNVDDVIAAGLSWESVYNSLCN